ncbi:MAG: VWA domain-containing protein [Blastocatellia bacterium]
MKNHLVRVFFYVFVATIGISATNAQPASTPTQREEVALPIIVLDPNGIPVSDLSKDRVKIFLDRVPQQITRFSQNEAPCSVVILLDISYSMRNNLQDIQGHLIEFLQNSNPVNEYSLIAFGSTSQSLVDWTKDTQHIVSGVKGINLKTLPKSTKLFDACLLALEKLQDRVDSKRVLFLITDAQEDRSIHRYEEIRRLCLANQITVLCAFFANGTSQTLLSSSKGQELINDLTNASGGVTYFVADKRDIGDPRFTNLKEKNYLDDLTNSLKALAGYLRFQYLLTFLPGGVKGDVRIHKLQVSITAPSNPAKEMKELRVRYVGLIPPSKNK